MRKFLRENEGSILKIKTEKSSPLLIGLMNVEESQQNFQ